MSALRSLAYLYFWRHAAIGARIPPRPTPSVRLERVAGRSGRMPWSFMRTGRSSNDCSPTSGTMGMAPVERPVYRNGSSRSRSQARSYTPFRLRTLSLPSQRHSRLRPKTRRLIKSRRRTSTKTSTTASPDRPNRWPAGGRFLRLTVTGRMLRRRGPRSSGSCPRRPSRQRPRSNPRRLLRRRRRRSRQRSRQRRRRRRRSPARASPRHRHNWFRSRSNPRRLQRGRRRRSRRHRPRRRQPRRSRPRGSLRRRPSRLRLRSNPGLRLRRRRRRARRRGPRRRQPRRSRPQTSRRRQFRWLRPIRSLQARRCRP